MEERLLSTTEMTVKFGIGRTTLLELAHRKGAEKYVLQNGAGGKFLWDPIAFRKFLERRTRR